MCRLRCSGFLRVGHDNQYAAAHAAPLLGAADRDAFATMHADPESDARLRRTDQPERERRKARPLRNGIPSTWDSASSLTHTPALASRVFFAGVVTAHE